MDEPASMMLTSWSSIWTTSSDRRKHLLTNLCLRMF